MPGKHSGFKMYGKSPMMKKLIGNQNKLPEELQAKILASPEKNEKPGPPMKYGSPMDMYGKKSMAKKYKSDAQRKAVHASKAEKGSMAKMYGKKAAPVKNYKKGYYGA